MVRSLAVEGRRSLFSTGEGGRVKTTAGGASLLGGLGHPPP